MISEKEIDIIEGFGITCTRKERQDGSKYVSFKFPKDELGIVVCKIAKFVAEMAVEMYKQSDPNQLKRIECTTQIAAMKGINKALDCLSNSLNTCGFTSKE